MNERRTPIERIPYLGFKQINLWNMFQAAETLGGYELITSRRQWKHVYDELGGNPGSTSAATCTRRHYERLILPYERFTKGEEDKPLPLSKPRKDLTTQQGVPKTKVPTVTQCPKEEQHPLDPQPPRTEQDPCAKGLKLSPECEEKDRSPEEEEGVKVKQEVQPSQSLPLPAGEVSRRTSEEEEEEEEVKVKQEMQPSQSLPLPAGEVSRSTSEEEESVAVCIKERVLHQGGPWENNQNCIKERVLHQGGPWENNQNCIKERVLHQGVPWENDQNCIKERVLHQGVPWENDQNCIKERVLHQGVPWENDQNCIKERVLHQGVPWENDQNCIKERVLHQGVQNNQKPPSDTATLDIFSVDTPTPINHPQDQWQKELPDYANPCPQARLDQSGLPEEPQGPTPGMVGIVGMVLPIRQRSLQSPKAPEDTTDRAQLPGQDHSCYRYSTILYPGRAHPGPGTNHPGTNQPGIKHPGTNHPGTNHPGTNHPGTNHPGTNHPGTNHPCTNHPCTSPGTNHPDTKPGTNPCTNSVTNHPGTMSDLAKKKLLSQVNGTASGPSLPNHYAFGPPPPLINTSLANGNAEESASQPIAGCQGSCSTDTAVVKRPSVIQHAQSFKPLFHERGDRREGLNRNLNKPGEPYSSCDLTHPPPQTIHHPQPHPNSTYDPYLLSPDPHHPQPHPNSTYDPYLLSPETPQPGHIPRFLPDFSSPPYLQNLHSLYNHTETHLSLNQEHLSQFISSRERETALPRDCEATPGPGGPGFPSSKHPDTVGLRGYCARINPLTPNLTPHTLRDMTSLVQTTSEDQPTDLSLPKSSPHKPTPSTATPSLHDHPLMPLQDTGRFCRVPPMTMSSSPKQPADPQPNPREKTLNGQRGGWEDQGLGHKMEELNRPILGTKNTSRPQNNVRTARPLKRSLEERENGPPERKIRAVTPMHSSSSSSSCTIRDRDREGHSERKVRTPALEGVVPADPQPALVHSLHLHINSFVEGHTFPLHSSPVSPGGLYPEAFISQIQDMCEGLGHHRPLGYQYLKNQAGLSPLVPPFAFHSFMMQRQAHSPAHMYRHPMGASYGELLHHGLHPMSSMSALNTQQHPDFSPSQLSSVHPNTKLS
ncbi:AT-rich interactive domain-containing protein 5B-like [Salvelinus alpinus]